MTLRTISYGGGVQSTALVIMTANRDPDFEEVMGGRVANALFANVGDDSEHPATLDFVRDVVTPWAAERDVWVRELQRHRRGGEVETLWGRMMRESRSIDIPVRMTNGAPGRRSCTADFKIKVVGKWLKQHGASADNPALVAIGISTDEVQRVSNKRVEPYEQPVYPLIELGWDRSRCQALIVETFGRTAPKSSCFFCPFHRPATWAEMRRDEPELFWQSVELERTLNDRRGHLPCPGAGAPPRERWSTVATCGTHGDDCDGWNRDGWYEDEDACDWSEERVLKPWPMIDRAFYDRSSGWHCSECGAVTEVDSDGNAVPHGKDHVYLTRFARPLDEAIGEAQTQLPGFESIGEAGCDEGYCFT